MKKLTKAFSTGALLALVLGILAGCSSFNDNADRIEPFITIGVLVSIEENEDITAEGILAEVAQFRQTIDLDGTVTAAEILNVFNLAVETSELPLSQQYALLKIIGIAERALENHGDDLAAVSTTADQILTWVETAARMAAD